MEILYENKLEFTDGDVLLQGDGVVLQNKDLIKAFKPKKVESFKLQVKMKDKGCGM